MTERKFNLSNPAVLAGKKIASIEYIVGDDSEQLIIKTACGLELLIEPTAGVNKDDFIDTGLQFSARQQ